MSKLLCWLLRKVGVPHKWRRLRKGEYALARKVLPELFAGFPTEARICDRCGNLRAVKSRAKKEGVIKPISHMEMARVADDEYIGKQREKAA